MLSMDTDALFVLLQTRPQVARRWFVSLAERLAGLQGRLVDMLAGGLESQLASLLLREGGAVGEVRLSHNHLVDLLGVRRTSVQRVLKSLESAGLVVLHYRRIELIDRSGLASLIDEPGETPVRSAADDTPVGG